MTHKILLTLHVLFAVLIIGPLALLDLVGPMAIKRGADELPVLRWGHRIAKALGPASSAVLVLGLILVWHSDGVEIGDTWVILAIILFIVAAVLGGAIGGKVYESAIGKLERGESAAAEASKAQLIGLVNFVVLVCVIWLMFDKPGAV